MLSQVTLEVPRARSSPPPWRQARAHGCVCSGEQKADHSDRLPHEAACGWQTVLCTVPGGKGCAHREPLLFKRGRVMAVFARKQPLGELAWLGATEQSPRGGVKQASERPTSRPGPQRLGSLLTLHRWAFSAPGPRRGRANAPRGPGTRQRANTCRSSCPPHTSKEAHALALWSASSRRPSSDKGWLALPSLGHTSRAAPPPSQMARLKRTPSPFPPHSSPLSPIPAPRAR